MPQDLEACGFYMQRWNTTKSFSFKTGSHIVQGMFAGDTSLVVDSLAWRSES